MIDRDLIETMLDSTPDEDFEGAIGEIVRRSAPGSETCLYLVDHGARELRRVDGSDTRVIEGRLLDVLLDREPALVDSTMWIPVASAAHVHAMLEVRSVDRQSLDDLGTIARVLGLYLTVSRGHTDLFERIRRRRRVSVAAEMQWDLLPTPTIEGPNWGLSCAFEPAYQIAGDVFDHAMYPSGFSAVVLDAMGHGQKAVLAAGLALAAVRNGRRSGANLAQSFRLANQHVREEFEGARYVTAFGIDVSGSSATVISAGHPRPWVLSTRGAERIDIPAYLPFGLAADTAYETATIDASFYGLLAITDGVTGARPDNGAPFGATKVEELAASRRWEEPRRLVRALMDQVIAHRAGEIEDDICIYAAIRRPEPTG